MLCAIRWSLDICMLVSSMTDIVQWLTAVKASLALEETLRKKALTTLFLRGTCFLELISTTNTGKILFFSFIFFGNCQASSSLEIVTTYIYFFFFFKLYKHTRILTECPAGSLSQSYSLLDFQSVYCWFELPQQKWVMSLMVFHITLYINSHRT